MEPRLNLQKIWEDQKQKHAFSEFHEGGSAVSAFNCSSLSPCRYYLKEEVSAGQILYASDVYTETVTHKKPTCCFSWIAGTKYSERTEEIHYLQAADTAGREVLLEFTQEGEFCEVGDAGTALSNSVYCLGDIVKYVDLPVHTKLAFGLKPTTPCAFTGMLRLEELYYEETIIACSLGGEKHIMVEFPTDSEIQFIVARNNADIMDSITMQWATRHCENHMEEYVNSIKVVQTFYPEHVKTEKNLASRCLPPVPKAPEEPGALVASNVSDKPRQPTEQNQVTVDVKVHREKVEEAKQNVQKIPQEEEEEEECHYETIPGEAESARHRKEAEDEQGYLIPVQVKHENRDARMRARMTDENGYLKQKRLLEEESKEILRSQMPDVVNEMLEKHLRERLDKFLIDSVQEFKRAQGHRSQDTPHDQSFSTSPVETTEDFQNYLETLFDCDKMVQDLSSSTPKPRFRRLQSSPAIWGDLPRDLPRDLPLIFSRDDSFRGLRRRNSAAGDAAQLPVGYKAPIRFSLSNPEATLRRHNVDHVLRPVNIDLNDERGEAREFPPRSATPSDLLGETRTFTSGIHFEVQSPRGTLGEAPLDQPHEPSGPRADSGIFVSCPPWNDPYTLDGDTVYRSESETSAWSPLSWSPPNWSPPSPADMRSASVQEVAQCLHYIGMRDDIVKHFVDEQIDGKQLLDLNDHLLSEGFPQLNALDRKKIVDFITGWRPRKL